MENRLASLADAPPSDEVRRDLTLRQRLALRLAREAEEHTGVLTEISENAEYRSHLQIGAGSLVAMRLRG